jgi:hypothetical protein
MLYRVVYLSSARQQFNPAEIELLLASGRRRNARDSITALLLYDNGHFLHALEGEDAVLPALMRRIQADRRHCDLTYVAAGPIEHRLFGRWGMAFSRALPGSLPDMVRAMTVTPDGSSDVALTMLKVFMRTVRPERAPPALRPPPLRMPATHKTVALP